MSNRQNKLQIKAKIYMGKNRKANSNGGLVYSTEHGRMCPQCLRAINSCVCTTNINSATRDGSIFVQRETKGRSGKCVTTINGLLLDSNAIKTLATELKRQCGVGGAVKSGVIEIQGDQRKKVRDLLKSKGFSVKFSGG